MEHNLDLLKKRGFFGYIEDWTFISRRPPLYYYEEVVFCIVGYLFTIRFLRFLMSFKEKPFELKLFSQV